jgi:hypothetical protein
MSATTTTALPPRLAFLRGEITPDSGEWGPARVGRTYRDHGYDAPKGTTHAADLRRLHRMGLLDQHNRPGGQYYVAKGAS